MMTAGHDYTDAAATFGDRVALAREAQGMTQEQLARRLGLRAATITNWEHDRAEPRANKLQMLAGVLSVSMIWLMTGVGHGPSLRDEDPELNVAEILLELREIRQTHMALIDRLTRLEKRLGARHDG